MWTIRPASDHVNKLAISKSGSGPKILFIHGVGLRLECWNGLSPYFKNFTCHAIDLPGHGHSENAPSELTEVRDFTDYIRQNYGETPDYIIGHSLGALITLDWAIRYPEGLRGIIPLNTIFERSESASAAVKTRAKNLLQTDRIDTTGTLTRWFEEEETPEREACYNWLVSNRVDQYAQAYLAFAETRGPSREDLRELNVPALFVTGSEEPNSTPDMSKAMAMLCPNAQSVIIEGAAHMAPMTHATEIAEHILSFMNSQRSMEV